jgi:hypothetical protein
MSNGYYDGNKYAGEGLATVAAAPYRYSLTEKLEAEKVNLETRLAQINKVLDALNANPGFQELFDLVAKHA